MIINDFKPRDQIYPGTQATHLAYSFLELGVISNIIWSVRAYTFDGTSKAKQKP